MNDMITDNAVRDILLSFPEIKPLYELGRNKTDSSVKR